MSSSEQYVGPYRLGKTLGVGANSKVKLGTHVDTGEKVAIKIVSKKTFEVKPNLLKKLEREIAILRVIDNPALLKLYDVYETSRYLFLILEFIEGGELFDYLIRKGKLPAYEALNFFQQIILGVDYCHKHLICHRDLKPENLLLDENMNVKIADFGLASQMQPENLLKTSCGSPHYACPEVVAGKKYDGFKADVWSMGVILFALLAGRLPFDDENIRTLLQKVMSGVFVMPEFFTSAQADLISHMIVVDPSERFTVAQVMDHPLFKSAPLPFEPALGIAEVTNLAPIPDEEIDPITVKMLKSLGWGRSKAIRAALSSPEPTYEKAFYLCITRDVVYSSSADGAGGAGGSSAATPPRTSTAAIAAGHDEDEDDEDTLLSSSAPKHNGAHDNNNKNKSVAALESSGEDGGVATLAVTSPARHGGSSKSTAGDANTEEGVHTTTTTTTTGKKAVAPAGPAGGEFEIGPPQIVPATAKGGASPFVVTAPAAAQQPQVKAPPQASALTMALANATATANTATSPKSNGRESAGNSPLSANGSPPSSVASSYNNSPITTMNVPIPGTTPQTPPRTPPPGEFADILGSPRFHRVRQAAQTLMEVGSPISSSPKLSWFGLRDKRGGDGFSVPPPLNSGGSSGSMNEARVIHLEHSVPQGMDYGDFNLSISAALRECGLHAEIYDAFDSKIDTAGTDSTTFMASFVNENNEGDMSLGLVTTDNTMTVYVRFFGGNPVTYEQWAGSLTTLLNSFEFEEDD